MGEQTKISWCDHTFNPWIGCTKVAAGCANCYAEADFDKRWHKAKWGPQGTRLLTSATNWNLPRKWDRKADHDDVRRRVFCGSLCDVFEDFEGWLLDRRGDIEMKGRAPSDEGYYTASQHLTLDDVRARLFATIDATPNLDWLLLTKRPENIRRMWKSRVPAADEYRDGRLALDRTNVWLGCSASTQSDLDASVPHLLACRDLAPVLFLSLEPLTGPMRLDWPTRESGKPLYSLTDYSDFDPSKPEPQDGRKIRRAIDWVIVGGESGHNARPCDVEWIRSIVRQCQSAGVPCFVKQLGAYPAVDVLAQQENGHVWKLTGYRDPKGGDPAEWMVDLRVREFPSPDNQVSS